MSLGDRGDAGRKGGEKEGATSRRSEKGAGGRRQGGGGGKERLTGGGARRVGSTRELTKGSQSNTQPRRGNQTQCLTLRCGGLAGCQLRRSEQGYILIVGVGRHLRIHTGNGQLLASSCLGGGPPIVRAARTNRREKRVNGSEKKTSKNAESWKSAEQRFGAP